MGPLPRCWFLGIMLFLIPMPGRAQSKTGSGTDAPGVRTWRVFGRVLTTQGEPMSDVSVQLEIGSSTADRRTMVTGIRGEFQTEIKLDSAKFPRLQGAIIAGKKGYTEGREMLDLAPNEKNGGVDIVLREIGEDPDQLSLTALAGSLAPRLRDEAARLLPQESTRKEFLRGCEELMEKHNAVAAVPLLNQAVQRTPNCLECRLLLVLALLNTGSWNGADKHLELASKAEGSGSAKRPEPALLMGALEAWRGRTQEAGRSYLRALEADPNNALALQELGRTLVAQKNWETADQYLIKALQAGAGGSARLLRARTLLELGKVDEASQEMGRYATGRETKNLPLVARILSGEIRDHLLLLTYKLVTPMTDKSPEELAVALPELQGLQPAADQSMLEEILKRTGDSVETYFRSFPNTVSLERVHQERLATDGKVLVSLDQEFQYLLLAYADKAGYGVEEQRSTAEGKDTSMAGLSKGVMLTSGFVSDSWIFHPFNRRGADFRYLGKQTVDDREAYVIAFAQKPQTAKMIERFTTNSGNYLVITHGVVWIDAKAFHIIRLRTDLLNPLPAIQLLKQTTEIQYHEVAFKGVATPLWLPQEVNVMVNLRGRIYRNRHRYSEFKLFNVESKEERKPPVVPESVPPPN